MLQHCIILVYCLMYYCLANVLIGSVVLFVWCTGVCVDLVLPRPPDLLANLVGCPAAHPRNSPPSLQPLVNDRM